MHNRFYAFLIILISIVGFNSLAIAKDSKNYQDGPYLIAEKPNQLTQYDVIDGALFIDRYRGGLGKVSHFEHSPSDNYQGVKKVAAISDIHGQFQIFKQLLQRNGIIDSKLNWQWGTGHLVITGDIFDRGDTVTEALWLVFKLEQQAKAAGGKLHYLLGNHEYMVLRGNEKYLHDKYHHTLDLMNMDLKTLFNHQTTLGQWLRSKSTVIKINDSVFMHGGIHQDFLDLNLTLEQTNEIFRSTIGQSRDTLKSQPITKVLYGRTGPIWYRGFFKDDLSASDVDKVLNSLQVKRIVVGHTSQQQLETPFDGRVIAIDTSIKRGVKGEILIINRQEDGTDVLIRGKMNGEQSPLLNK